MGNFSYFAADLAATDHLGKLLADNLTPGTVIALIGTLGAGKTRLVQAVAAGLGAAANDVTSPTFMLVNEYVSGRMPVYHFDTYRLRDDDEFLQLGPEEYFDGDGVTFVEWADRVTDCLPRDYLRIEIEVAGESQREFKLTASSNTYAALIERLKKGATTA